jgi:hypothetical protein
MYIIETIKSAVYLPALQQNGGSSAAVVAVF